MIFVKFAVQRLLGIAASPHYRLLLVHFQCPRPKRPLDTLSSLIPIRELPILKFSRWRPT